MSYWLREIAGWLLVLAGLYVFWTAADLLLRQRLFEAGPMTAIGFIVFRGGIHLLKVAVAAQAARHLPGAFDPPGRRPARVVARPVGPTPASQILPGPPAARPRG